MGEYRIIRWNNSWLEKSSSACGGNQLLLLECMETLSIKLLYSKVRYIAACWYVMCSVLYPYYVYMQMQTLNMYMCIIYLEQMLSHVHILLAAICCIIWLFTYYIYSSRNSLDERKVILGAKSTLQLCKACLFENKNYKPNKDNKKKK